MENIIENIVNRFKIEEDFEESIVDGGGDGGIDSISYKESAWEKLLSTFMSYYDEDCINLAQI